QGTGRARGRKSRCCEASFPTMGGSIRRKSTSLPTEGDKEPGCKNRATPTTDHHMKVIAAKSERLAAGRQDPPDAVDSCGAGLAPLCRNRWFGFCRRTPKIPCGGPCFFFRGRLARVRNHGPGQGVKESMPAEWLAGCLDVDSGLGIWLVTSVPQS